MMAAGGPAAGGATAGKFLRQTQGRTIFGLKSFESIPETSRGSVETCTWAAKLGYLKAAFSAAQSWPLAYGIARKRGCRRGHPDPGPSPA